MVYRYLKRKNRIAWACVILCLLTMFILWYTASTTEHLQKHEESQTLNVFQLLRNAWLVIVSAIKMGIESLEDATRYTHYTTATVNAVTKELKPLWVDMHQEFKVYAPYGTKEFVANVSNFKHKILMYYHVDWVPMLDLSDCEYGNCAMTSDRSHLNTSDAVLFYVGEPLPDEIIEARPKNQIWIFYTLEPPYKIPRYINMRNVFNWSITYRRESKIPHPYGVLLQRQTPLKRNYHEIFAKKTKFAAWIVSHCRVQSNRMKYVKLLQKYIPVDIYGTCGKSLNKTHDDYFSDEFVIRNTLKDYKFYLSFENSLCSDYVSEKIFHYLSMDLILVARGGADYKTLIPKELIINTADFSSVQQLAEYLKMLNSSETEYVKYLKAVDKYEIKYQNWPWKNSLCKVCRRLNNRQHYQHIYTDASAWFIDGQCKDARADLKEKYYENGNSSNYLLLVLFIFVTFLLLLFFKIKCAFRTSSKR